MRIVHVSDCYLPRLGGIEQQVSGLAEAQAQAGHEVHVITATRHAEPAEAAINGVQVHRLTAPLPFDLPLHPRAGRVIHRQLAALGADVVHVHLGAVSPFAWAGLRAAEALHLPTLSSVHSIWGPLSRTLYRIGRQLLHWPSGTRISAVSRAAADLVEAAAGADVTVIGNGVDLAGWTAVDRRSTERLQLVSATRFAPRKRVLSLLLLMVRLRWRLRDQCPRLTIAGSGELWRVMQLLLRVLGLAEVVRLPGRLTRAQLAQLYRDADLFVQLSVRESFGLAAIEARAAGLPVIGRQGNGFTEFVTDGLTGLLVASDRAAAAAIERLHADRAQLATLQANSVAAPPVQTWQSLVAQVDAEYLAARNDLR